MPAVSRLFLLIAGISLMLAAMLSAYGLHGLPGKVPAEKLVSWEWANQLQFFHSIGLMLIAILLGYAPRSLLLRLAGGLMLIGLVLFAGGIYLPILGAPEALGKGVPVGGGSFMLGWLLTGIAGFRIRGLE
jgi:uncharacterized membrane protein YgdD (TMEM256/DUF423 family)